MPERVVLLVNPSAGPGRGLQHQRAVERILGQRGPVTTVTAADEAMLADAAGNAASAGHTIVVAGGDGTVHRVVQALGASRGTLGVIPAGSGNDFARALGLPRDPREAARRVARSPGIEIDLVEVNGRPCCTVGGLGLIADVTADIGRRARPGVTRAFVRSLGSHAYLLAALRRLAMPSSRAWSISVEGTGPDGSWQWSGRCHALFVANFPTLGAGLALPIVSAPDDGQAELCIVPRRGRVSLAFRLAALRSGRPQPECVLTVRRTIRATIVVQTAMAFAADGEVVCIDRRFEVIVRERALVVLC